MPNRVKDMDLTQIVANNLQRICKEHDLSSRELSLRADMPQKTVYNMVQGDHACRLSNLEKLCKTLLVSPTVMVTPHLGTNMLMSRRVPRIIENFSKLSMADREKMEAIMGGMLGIEEEEDNME